MGLEKLHEGEGFRKLEEFEEKLLLIEAKYIDFFKGREPVHSSEKHDRLSRHYFTQPEEKGLAFGFNTDSEVPYHIQRECHSLFQSIFTCDTKSDDSIL